MKLSYTHSASTGNSRERDGNLSRKHQNIGFGNSEHYFPLPNIWTALKQLAAGLARLFVILKYFLHGMLPSLKGELKLPWFKIGLIALTLFIVSKKDINFSINTSSPEATEATLEKAGGMEELSLVKTVSFKQKAQPKKNVPLDFTPSDAEVKAYVKRFTRVAQIEMDKFGIPASVKMAQAILESGAGLSRMAKQDNNHFGRPLAGNTYENAWENWRAHSLFLKSDYSEVFDGLTYKEWVKAFQNSDYTTDKNYDKKLTQIIEKYQLFLLDEQI